MGQILTAVVLVSALGLASGAELPNSPAYVFTTAPRYDAGAWLNGRERFPSGAKLMYVSARTRQPVAPGFAASADPAVSFDGARILFAGKRAPSDRWQIWETAPGGGTPRQVTSGDADCVRPLYLPDARVAYTRLSAAGPAVETVPLGGGPPQRLTFAPGRFLTDDVLRDGRILFEMAAGAFEMAAGAFEMAAGAFEMAAGANPTRELFTVYPDGTGVESLRCDHGPDRADARQLASGDVIFRTGERLARFRSALARQTDVAQPGLAPAGPPAEVSAGEWIIALRPKPAANFALFQWTAATGQLAQLESPAGANALQPAVVAARVPPREFPSALVPTRTTGNLLCLNAKASKDPIAADIRAVRVYTQTATGAPLPLGQSIVETDGSFYVEVPADRPLRIELLDAAGASIRAEHTWFWMRPSEQRICVGCHAGPERSPENQVPAILNRSTVPTKLLPKPPVEATQNR